MSMGIKKETQLQINTYHSTYLPLDYLTTRVVSTVEGSQSMHTINEMIISASECYKIAENLGSITQKNC